MEYNMWESIWIWASNTIIPKRDKKTIMKPSPAVRTAGHQAKHTRRIHGELVWKISKIVLSVIICMAFILALVSAFTFYFISGYINSIAQAHVVSIYNNNVSQMSPDIQMDLLNAAHECNEHLSGNSGRFWVTADDTVKYSDLLNVNGGGVMCLLDIPKLKIKVPVYHGTDAATLKNGIGHLQGSSLPVGGPGTHAVIAGHRGEPSAHFFEHLDKLVIGDKFMITVLNETLTYEVDQVLVVDPDDYSALQIVPGDDYVTLMTCTPYGSNSYRLLVRGYRVS